MKIAIRNDEIFLERDWQKHFIDGTKDLTKAPYNYKIIVLEEINEIDYDKLIYSDFDYIGEQYYFNIERFRQRNNIDMRNTYELTVERLIRERYSISQELAILRQQDAKTEEFQKYNEFCESCKATARLKIANSSMQEANNGEAENKY